MNKFSWDGCGSLYAAGAREVTKDMYKKNTIYLAITRGTPPSNMSTWQNIKELSPSWDLLNKWNKGRKDIHAFNDYVSGWKIEKKNNTGYDWAIQRICEHLKNGTDVVIGCFCVNYDMCHRSLVAKDVCNRMNSRY